MEEKLKNNYWRVANGYAPSPDNTQTAPKPELKPSETVSGDETWRKAERSEWGDFPPLIRNSSLEELKNTDGYREAKTGNPQAALYLVQSLLSEQTIADIRKMANGREPILVGIRAEETKGTNKIPIMMAQVLSHLTGWELDMDLYQISYAGRTGSDSSYRLAFPAVFGGEVKAGRDYLLLDDNSTMGGTIASLKGYIENRGGKVIGAAVMSARATGLELIPTEKQLNDIQRKHGDAANDFFQKTYGYGIRRLTRSEAGAVRTSPTIDGLRNRIDEARLSVGRSMGERGTETQPAQIASVLSDSVERKGEIARNGKAVKDNTVTQEIIQYEKIQHETVIAQSNQTEILRVPNVSDRRTTQEPKELRTAWNDFFPVVSNGKLGDLKNQQEYLAAKAGDFEQSAVLVEKLLKDETVAEIKKLIGKAKPILLPIQSEEASGKNRIPHALARALADKLDLQVDIGILQSNTAKRTDSGIYHRYVSSPEFKGEVKVGQSYLIVDDTLSVGGTIAALKGYIENRGGQVIGLTVMTAYGNKVDIVIKYNMLQSLMQKTGLNEYWLKEFGYGVDKLTQQEAGHLRKPTLEQVQERVQAARQDLELSKNSEFKFMGEQQSLNLLKPNNNRYTQHLQLTGQQLEELRQYGKKADEFFKAYFSRNRQANKR